MLNSTEYVEAVFACSAIGLIAVPLNWRLGHDELAFILADCAPRTLIHHRSFEDRATALHKGCSAIERRLAIARGHCLCYIGAVYYVRSRTASCSSEAPGLWNPG